MLDTTGQDIQLGDFAAFPNVSRTLGIGVIIELTDTVAKIKYPHVTRKWVQGGRWANPGVQPIVKAGLRMATVTLGHVVKINPTYMQTVKLLKPYWFNHEARPQIERETTVMLFELSKKLKFEAHERNQKINP